MLVHIKSICHNNVILNYSIQFNSTKSSRKTMSKFQFDSQVRLKPWTWWGIIINSLQNVSRRDNPSWHLSFAYLFNRMVCGYIFSNALLLTDFCFKYGTDKWGITFPIFPTTQFFIHLANYSKIKDLYKRILWRFKKLSLVQFNLFLKKKFDRRKRR